MDSTGSSSSSGSDRCVRRRHSRRKDAAPSTSSSSALKALQKFFASLVQYANTSFETLSYSLISTAKPSQSGGVSKQALSSIAQFVVVLCLAAGNNAADLGIHIVLLQLFCII
ncbi:hypothetical protein ZWY2020_043838 [Hordeum vulgare]|nr:hypothetical protein ZWY2020_043838 [Hordeum vulgare]